MIKRIFSFLIFCSIASASVSAQTYKYPFQNPSLPLDERVSDLVSRMTLNEKISQMLYEAPAIERLGVPSYNWWNECLHGVARAGEATVFPQGIGMAAAFDADLMYRIADVTSDEARAKHHDFIRQGKRGMYEGLTFWTPNINIFRDPRWGRGQETYGEDPYLAGELGVQFVKGLQGNDPKYLKCVATVKHFAVHSGPEPLRHSFDITTSDRDLFETYLPAFKRVVTGTNVESVMCAYNRFRGEPCCGSSELMQTILRDKWGFQGYIVSDCGAIRDFFQGHNVVSDAAEAAAKAVLAGTDLNCGTVYQSLGNAIRRGLIKETDLDRSVIRLFTARFKLGMFDPDAIVPFAQMPISTVDSEANRAVALESARKSIVLLKNDGALPLKKSLRKVAVIGPTANDYETLWGNYSGYNKSGVTVLQGIKNKLPGATVDYEVGCELSGNFPQVEPIPAEYLYQDAQKSARGVKAAYYNNPNLWGTPTREVVEPQINKWWWGKAPYPEIPYDNFGVRYETYIEIPETGRYALGIEGFYGYKYYVNDSLVFTYSNVHHPSKKFELRDCKKGEIIKIGIDYRHEIVNNALISLFWGRADNDVLMRRAVDLAKKSDVVVLCMGINQNLEGEEMKVKVQGFEGGDRTEITLPHTQQALIREIKKLGKPTILVLQNGSPISVAWENDNVNAIVEAWYGGQAAGTAVADVLFGDYNPAGRLPVTVYKSLSDLPAFDDYAMAGRTYRYFEGTPLYEFGYGLSYTKFRYSGLKMPAEMATDKAEFEVSADVANTGGMDGEEVVQLYVGVKGSPYTAPIRSLRGFQRIPLAKGETKKVTFRLSPDDLAVLNDKGEKVVCPSQIEITVGGKQPDPVSLKNGGVVKGNVKLTGQQINL